MPNDAYSAEGMIAKGTEITCVCGNDNSTAYDLPGNMPYRCLRCGKVVMLAELAENYKKLKEADSEVVTVQQG